MKTFLIALAAATLLAHASPPARAQGSISVDFFYDNLSPQGNWLDVGDYGYVWQPYDIHDDWSPYSDGRWVYTEAGWTWDSYEPYGWAVYHYGRWANVRQVGWIWVPGTEWGPAWVSWRHSPSHVGWAPLPPEARYSVSIGFHSWVDDYYDIGPGQYRFVEGRNFGSPHLDRSFVDRGRNVTLINETTNITNITYQNNIIHNGGPVFEDQMRQSSEPISRYKLNRRQGFDGDPRHQTPDQLRSRVEGDTLVVAAPNLVEGGSRAPAKVSKTVRDAEVDRGWNDAGSPQEVAALRSARRAKAEVPAGLPREPKFERPAASPRSDAPVAAEPREKGKGVDSPRNEPATTRPMNPTADGPGNAAADQTGRNEGKGKMSHPATPGQPATPRPPAPGNDPGREKAPLPNTPPNANPGSNRPRPENQTGRPGTDNADPGRKNPSPQPQPPHPAPQGGAGRMTPERQGDPGRTPGAGEKGKGAGNPAPVPPAVGSGSKPERNREKDKDKDKD